MKVKIYQPAKSAMQSGKNNHKKWLLTPIEEENIRSVNPLTGWVSVNNTQSQLKLFFTTKEEAIDYAIGQKFDYELEEPKVSVVKKKSYAANFT
ncbi:MAG: ETC complex I subunit [Rickettsiales bacterium]|nr:ETC complex I subunit [Rickettsiales bacterium]